MRKNFVVFGLILICAGPIIFSFHNVRQENIIEDFERVEDSWTISRGDFKAGENLSVGFVPGGFWGWPPHDSTTVKGVYYEHVKEFVVKVIDDTTGNYTEFSIILGMPTSAPYSSDEVGYLQIRVHKNEGGLLVEDNPREIGGIVQNDGTYIVKTLLYPDWVQNITTDENNQTKIENMPVDAPSELRLYRIITEYTYPYKALIVVGPVITCAGFIISMLGVQKKRKTQKEKQIKVAK